MLSVNLEPVFGKVRRNQSLWDPIIVIRHGVCSSRTSFLKLEAYLDKAFPKAKVDNESYAWRDSVLVNGARLAYYLQTKYDVTRPLVLIGHSMGGLVCRVANVALRDPKSFSYFVSTLAMGLGYTGTDWVEMMNFRLDNQAPRDVALLATLATPNSGAMLQGQVSGIAALLQAGINVFPPTRTGAVADLTTDRLFRFLQNFCVNTAALSISGSRANRFALGAGHLTAWFTQRGLRMEMPHDLIVEDRSVDLKSSILPNEIVQQGTTRYAHVRTYSNCTDVSHTSIYDDATVREIIVDCMLRC